jgi:hypothetical protein
MHDRNRAVKKKVTITLVAMGDDDQDMPDMIPVSDDDISIDSSQQSNDSESEGGIWDNYANDDVGFAPEGANRNLILLDSPVRSPVGQRNEGANRAPDIVPDPALAPEGATRRTRDKARKYPEAVWRRGTDGKLERVSLNAIRSEHKKLNCDMFALTFGPHEIPPMAQKMSKKRQRLNYK